MSDNNYQGYAPQPVQPQAQQIPQQPPAYQQQAQQQYQQPQIVPETSLKAAMHDIKSTPNYMSKLAKLGLIGIVPVLDFTIYGKLGKWNQELTANYRTTLPETPTVSGDNFVKGLWYFVIMFLTMFVVGFANIIPIIGGLAVLVASLTVLTPFIYLAFMRGVLFGSIGEMFKLGDIIDKLKRNFGELWCASVAPGLISGLIGGAILALFSLIGTLVLMGTASTVAGTGTVVKSNAVAMFASGGIMTLFLLIGGALAVFCCMIGSVIAIRGTGHWIARYVPEWNAQATAQYRQQQAQMRQAQAMGQQYQPQQQPYQAPTYQPNYSQMPHQQPQQAPQQHPTYNSTVQQQSAQVQPQVEPQAQPQPTVDVQPQAPADTDIQ